MAFTVDRGRLQRLPLLNIIAVLVLIGAGLAAWNIWRGAQITEPVVVAASDIRRGATVEASDLRSAEMKITGETRALIFGEASFDSLVGQRAARDVTAGALLTTADLAQGPLLEADEVAVTLALARGMVHPDLRAGDDVIVLTWEDSPEGREMSVLFDSVRVVRVDDDPFTITLAIPRDGLLRAGAAATTDRIWIGLRAE